VAKTVEEFRSVVVLKEPPPNRQSLLPQHFKVKISKQNANWLRVKLVPREPFVEITETEDSLFAIVDSGEDLEIQISDDPTANSKTARVVRKDRLLSNLPLSLPLQDVTTTFLNRVAHFHFFLYHNYGRCPDSRWAPFETFMFIPTHIRQQSTFGVSARTAEEWQLFFRILFSR
jgi:hypothetical protein